MENGWHMFTFGQTVSEQLKIQVLRMAILPQLWQVIEAGKFKSFNTTKTF